MTQHRTYLQQPPISLSLSLSLSLARSVGRSRARCLSLTHTLTHSLSLLSLSLSLSRPPSLPPSLSFAFAFALSLSLSLARSLARSLSLSLSIPFNKPEVDCTYKSRCLSTDSLLSGKRGGDRNTSTNVYICVCVCMCVCVYMNVYIVLIYVYMCARDAHTQRIAITCGAGGAPWRLICSPHPFSSSTSTQTPAAAPRGLAPRPGLVPPRSHCFTKQPRKGRSRTRQEESYFLSQAERGPLEVSLPKRSTVSVPIYKRAQAPMRENAGNGCLLQLPEGLHLGRACYPGRAPYSRSLSIAP